MESSIPELTAVLREIRALEPIALPLLDALGCVLAQAISAPADVPAFATVEFSGFAMSVATYVPGSIAEIVDDVPAGFRATEQLGEGACIKVARGAPLPEGADAVVGHSRAQLVDGGVICEATEAGEGFVPVGDLIRAGELLARAGQLVGSDLLGILARAGIRSVEVHPRPRVLVVTVGSEYVEPGVPTPIGLVTDHLSQLAAALVTEHGAITFRIPPVLDDLAEIAQVVDDNAHRSDLIVLCGLEPETAPAIAEALGLSLGVSASHNSGVAAMSEPVIHGMSGGAVIVGLPDDSTQLRAIAREILPRILDRLMGRSAQ